MRSTQLSNLSLDDYYYAHAGGPNIKMQKAEAWDSSNAEILARF
jgi:hypothetical protein